MTTILSHRVAVYVPGTDGLDALASEALVRDGLNYVTGKLAQQFGGSTVIDGYGTYQSDSGELVREPVKIVYAFTNKLDNAAKAWIVGLAEFVKEYFNQESVAIEVDSALWLV